MLEETKMILEVLEKLTDRVLALEERLKGLEDDIHLLEGMI
jgi:hypothetical protein